MDTPEANRIARKFLREQIELEHSEPPNGLYGFKPSEEIVFRFRLFGHSTIGSSEYVAVSKKTGAVRYLGSYGE